VLLVEDILHRPVVVAVEGARIAEVDHMPVIIIIIRKIRSAIIQMIMVVQVITVLETVTRVIS
jgi:hypothetical protein